MLGRVLVLSASAGAGHLRAAEAIEKAIRLRGRCVRSSAPRRAQVHEQGLSPPLFQSLHRPR